MYSSEGGLDRLESTFEQLSASLLSSASVDAKIDSQTAKWIRALFGDDLYLKLVQ